jgi:phosphate starvation-inducible PhoH-like protein
MTQRGSTQRKKTRQDKVNEGGQRVVKEKFMEERNRRIIPLEAKTQHQKEALEAFKTKPLSVLSGSSGVGKSELMCWWASKLWLEGKVDSIVITRPHQSLGNDYGAVTGNDAMKLLPFCMSMLMKFKKYLGVGILRNNFQMEVAEGLFNEARGISIVPVEKIQGLSFNERTIICSDELQNATPAQVKALVTRCEEGAQLICAGDKTQSALKGENGLAMLERILEKYPTNDAAVIRFTPKDNCRSGISGHLAAAFEKEGTW